MADQRRPAPPGIFLAAVFLAAAPLVQLGVDGGGIALPGAHAATRLLRVRVVSPAAGAVLDWGQLQHVAWTSRDLGARAHETRILLTTDGGRHWKRIATLPADPGAWDWLVPEVPGVKRECRLRVDVRNARGRVIARGGTAGVFTIRGLVSRYGPSTAESYRFQTLQLGRTAAGDLDGDSRDEVAAIACEELGCFTIKVMRRDGALSLPVVATLFTWGFLDLKGIVAADLNHDGRTDLAVSAVSTLGGTMLARVLVLRQDPVTGQVGAASQELVLAADRIGDLVSGDFNGDGRTDLAVLTEPTFSGGLGAVSLLLQGPTGLLLTEKRYAASEVLLEGAIGAGDLDGDGRTDFVYQVGPRELAVALQDPLALPTGFAPPLFVTTAAADAPAVSHVAVGDLDNDGAEDVAVVAGAALHLFRGWDGGAFSGVGTFALATPPRSVAIADNDGDRVNDVLLSWPTRLAVYRQTWRHTFRPPLELEYCFAGPPPDPDLAGSLLQADVNDDGIPDAIASGYRGDLHFVLGAPLP